MTSEPRPPILLDCSSCVGAETEECDDCLVRAVLDPPGPVLSLLDDGERRAVEVMARAGLLGDGPRLRLAG